MSKKKKNSANKDVIAVLFIFAVMILLALGFTMCGRDEVELSGDKQGTEYEKREDDNSGEIVVMTAAGIAVVIVVCFAIKKAGETKRRNQAIQKYNEMLEEKRRIEEARERVRQARLQEMIDAGVRQLTEKDKHRTRVVRRGNAERRWDDDFDSMDINDKRLSSYYRDKYSDLDDDDLFTDDYDAYDDEGNEPETLIEKVRYLFSSINVYWWIVIGIAIVAIIGGALIAIFVL